jgi:murein DD-endopeptidase MepM/ murein hydrolase activator NlpD
LLGGVAHAQLTGPVSGAVPKPAGFDISWPFTAGEEVRVTAGYSPSGGSGFHDGTNGTGSANDYYALDLVLPQHANGGKGQPILAVQSGTVVKAGWATGGWASYGQRVIIQHDWSGDGHTYVSIYCHLDTIDVIEGQVIDKGTQLGTMGGSSNGSLSGFAPHLHFALHRDSTIGGSGTGGSYGGNAVVPEPMDGYEDLAPGTIAISANSAQPCQVLPPSGGVLDDQGPCFRRFGPAQYWNDESSGYMSSSVWTYTIDQTDPDNSVRWLLDFEQAGEYVVEAYIPAGLGQATQAKYVVRHGGTQDSVTRDQSSVSDGWLSIGSFGFAAGGDQWIELADNTGEPYTGTDSTRIVFDAIRIRPAASGGGDAGTNPGDPDAGPGGGSDGGAQPGADAGAGDPGADGDVGSGCGCAGTRGNGAGSLVMILLAILAAVIHRRGVLQPVRHR